MRKKIWVMMSLTLCACFALLAGCGEEETTSLHTPVESLPVVVADSSSSGASSKDNIGLPDNIGHSHDCNAEGTLCGTIINGVFQDNEKTFRVTLPDGWTIQEKELTDQSMILGSPSDSSILEIRRQKNDPNLFSYTQAEFEESYKTGITDFQIITFEQTTIQNHRAVHMVYTCTNSGVMYQFHQYIIAGDYDYNLTFMRRTDEPDFSQNFLESISSFQEISPIKDPQSNQGKLIGTLYTAADNSYTINLPEGWRVDSSADYLLARSADKASNMNVLINEADNNLINYTQSYFQEYYSGMFSSAKVTSFEKITMNGYPALHLVCSYQANGKNLIANQYLICAPKNTYSLTYTSSSNALAATFQTSAQSLKISS
ncbi:MAG: hypothetical protein HFJ84_11310 [Clostridiales bacterium]|jgi:predicted Zn-dependent protease|nr:hypothetical protein [Clostridiales bacterium]